MDQFLSFLNRAIEGTPLIALTAAFTWGIMSIVLSPCHLASIPLIVEKVKGVGSLFVVITVPFSHKDSRPLLLELY